jgi:glycosyltransferase involved in cell wall biosynthesis
MKLSLFTPTHRATFLPDLFASLKRQEGEVPWEWVIVPNGDCKPSDIQSDIRAHPNVRIVPSGLKGIGALKLYACDSCFGDVFVEMDHDDTLAPDAFKHLAEAYATAPNGFYYSDFINVRPNGSCETYGFQYGWQNYNVEILGKNYTACRAFPPTARSMCHIFYAPNHVRAWSRMAYERAGGHNPKLTVGDDHDLVCRTYCIPEIPFVWIKHPIYLYRRWDQQSFLTYNKEIQIQQNENCNQYLHQLISAECKRDNLTMVDMGRESRCPEGYLSHDIVNRQLPVPFKDNSIGCLRVFDTLQRLPRKQIIPTMNEFYRILLPGGWLVTSTPAIDDGKGKVGRGAFQDPTHCSYWSENNFDYWTMKRYANLVPEYTGKFQSVRVWTNYPSEDHKARCIPYVHADLCALKGQRQPGESYI